MIAGTQLIRRIAGGQAHVFSTPLVINKQTGVKFGKSEDGAVWLDPTKTSPYKFYQFWLNCDDETSEDLIKIYTLLDQTTVESLIARHRENPGARELQRVLAREVTDLVHGRERRESVERVTAALFGGAVFESLTDDDIEALSAEIPTASFGTVVDSLVNSGVVSSNGEAKRLIAGGGVTVNGEKVLEDMSLDATSLIRKGKNSFVLVR
jgi:tyrosyl-tRNA synthetase